MSGMFDLAGRVAVVTGGNGGLGLGMARGLAEAGATTVIWGRNPDKTKTAAEAIGAHAVPCDVSDKASIEAAMAETLSRFGRVDGLFANAGVSTEDNRVSFLDRTDEEWARLMRVNLDGVRWSLGAAGRHMRERAKEGDAFGRLVVTSSVSSIDGTPFNEHYSASKGAVNALVRSLAVELARWGVTVNAILPGFCESEMTQRLLDNERFMAAVIPRIPARRFGTADDFKGLPVYLMSGASDYHNGQCFVIDGGYSVF